MTLFDDFWHSWRGPFPLAPFAVRWQKHYLPVHGHSLQDHYMFKLDSKHFMLYVQCHAKKFSLKNFGAPRPPPRKEAPNITSFRDQGFFGRVFWERGFLAKLFVFMPFFGVPDHSFSTVFAPLRLFWHFWDLCFSRFGLFFSRTVPEALH